MPYISLENVSVAYQQHAVLKNVTVQLPDRQITAVIGPSGCGKTTLLRSINRFIDLNEGARVSGAVCIDGQNIYAPRADLLALRTKVGFLSQRPTALPFSIYDNVAYGPRIHRMTIADMTRVLATLEGVAGTPPGTRTAALDTLVQRCLALAGLWNEVHARLNEPAHRLSIGQLQRLALARALAVGPEAILADEPTSALDPISTRLIEQQLVLLKQRFSILIVTHILRQARRLADYMLFMYMGELVEHGPAAELFARQTDPRTRAYMSGEIS